jgi:hypothetical protein
MLPFFMCMSQVRLFTDAARGSGTSRGGCPTSRRYCQALLRESLIVPKT